MSSVLITGGTGFLGHGLTEALLAESLVERIRIYSRGEVAQFQMRERYPQHSQRLAFFVGDVRDRNRLERAMAGMDFVIHAAALKRIEVGHYNPDEMIKTNVLGTMNVIEAARRNNVRRVVFVSSDKAFEPVSPYGLTKALAEDLVRAANHWGIRTTFAVCRYGNVAGSTGSVIPIWRERLAKGLSLEVRDPEMTRFWMSRAEAVQLVIDVLARRNLTELASTHDETYVPKLPAYRLEDLAFALVTEEAAERRFSIQYTKAGAWEKMHESMVAGVSSDRARRLSVGELRELLKTV